MSAQPLRARLIVMKIRFSTVVPALACAVLASCYPYDESRDRRPQRKPIQKSVSSQEQQKIQAQREQLKQTETLPMQPQATPPVQPPVTGSTTPPPTQPTPPPTPKPPVEEKRPDYAIANKVPGKDGFVFSPYNNKIVDVRDIPSGTLVQDPTYTGAGKGYFRVP
jgi:hypothetical protein